MIEHAFGQSPPWSLGVEEELMILDDDTLGLAPAVSALVAAAERRELPGRFKTELFASVVELTTGVCPTAAIAAEDVWSLRRAAAEVAGRLGLRLAAAGSHPFSVPELQEIVPEERYERFVEYAGITARRQGVNGLHVHVGVPTAAACLHAMEGVLPWLPVVLALSANSPFLSGSETGHASARAEILALLPRHGAPPPFGSWTEWERYVAVFVDVGLVEDYTQFWWDVRPHPRFGTLEIRIADQPTSPLLTAALVGLLQALVATAVEQPPAEPDAAARGVYEQNRWAALHAGARAELVHPRRDRLASVPALAEELVALVGPALDELGTRDLLSPLDPSRCEADRQLEVGRVSGLRAVCEDLVERSLPSDA